MRSQKKDLRLMSTRESESLPVPFLPLDKDGYFRFIVLGNHHK